MKNCQFIALSSRRRSQPSLFNKLVSSFGVIYGDFFISSALLSDRDRSQISIFHRSPLPPLATSSFGAIRLAVRTHQLGKLIETTVECFKLSPLFTSTLGVLSNQKVSS
jgi:hypothetical protein